MIMSQEDLEALDYQGEDGKTIPLPRSRRALIRAFQAFMRENSEVDDYFTLTQEAFDTYRIHSYNPNASLMTPLPTSRKPSSSSRPPADDFKKSVKRDQNHYDIFKTDKEWDSWNHSSVATTLGGFRP